MPRQANPGSPSAALPQVPQRMWVVRSRLRAILFAVTGGVTVTLSTIITEWLFYQEGQPPMLMMAASDVLAGLLTAVLLLHILNRTLERGEAVVARLQMLAEMNHHVRNALSMIQLSTASVADANALAAIREGCDRIEWALREILASGGNARGAQNPAKTPATKPAGHTPHHPAA